MKWQRIETAPKDGTRFLAFGMAYAELAEDGRVWVIADTSKPRLPFITEIKWIEQWYDALVEVSDGLFRKERTLSFSGWDPHDHAFQPTHWMPLPDPPRVTS